MSWLMVLPAIDPAKTAGFFELCKLPHDQILLVDNTTSPWTLMPDGWDGRLVQSGRNLGVPASWNLGVQTVIAEQIDYLVLASTSFRFGESGGRDFIDAVEMCDTGGVWCQHGWHLIAIGRAMFERVGEFDEAFWPGYWEESDLCYRLWLTGEARRKFVPGDGFDPHENWCRVEVDGEFGEQAATLAAGLVPTRLLESAGYYEMKWGGPQGFETYEHPFNDPAMSVRAVQQNGYT